MEKVAGSIETPEQKMDVIRHQAISVNGDLVGSGCRLKPAHEPSAGIWGLKDSFAVFAAESYEKPFCAAVSVCWEADVFVDEDHRDY